VWLERVERALVSRPIRLLCCFALGTLPAVAVLYLARAGADDVGTSAIGLVALLAGVAVADRLLPGPTYGFGRERPGAMPKIAVLIGFVALVLVTRALAEMIGPGWAAPAVMVWGATLLIGLLLLDLVWPPRRGDDG
jgi:hypothetical protein